MYIPGTTYLHILLHCTLYLIAHLTPYFISLFVSYFILTIFVYIYILSRVLFHSFLLLLCYFYFIIMFFFFFCTFHWADLSWLTFHYSLYPVWLCMWQIIKNLEPTLNLYEHSNHVLGGKNTLFSDLSGVLTILATTINILLAFLRLTNHKQIWFFFMLNKCLKVFRLLYLFI